MHQKEDRALGIPLTNGPLEHNGSTPSACPSMVVRFAAALFVVLGTAMLTL